MCEGIESRTEMTLLSCAFLIVGKKDQSDSDFLGRLAWKEGFDVV